MNDTMLVVKYVEVLIMQVLVLAAVNVVQYSPLTRGLSAAPTFLLCNWSILAVLAATWLLVMAF